MGGTFLRDLCDWYPHQSICCVAIGPPSVRSEDPSLDWLPVLYLETPRVQGFGRGGPLLNHLSGLLFRTHTNLRRVPAIVDRAVRFGREQPVSLVWAVLNTPTVIRCARAVALALDVPMVTTVWDPPERLIHEAGFDRLSRVSVLREFGKALRQSARCGVASDPMAEDYKERYDVTPVVLIHGLHSRHWRTPARVPSRNGQLVIGFAGSLYATDTWDALLAALGQAGWEIDGRSVRIRVLGKQMSFSLEEQAHIDYMGWKSLDETVEALSDVDISYLPYWFDESHSLSVRLCFPNKLSAYLAAGRPVFFMVPGTLPPAASFSSRSLLPFAGEGRDPERSQDGRERA